MYQIPPVTELTRVEKLNVALGRAKVTVSNLAHTLGVTDNTIRRLLYGETIPPVRHQQLVSIGIPPELLPRPEYITPGPKPQADDSLGEAA
jgi:hypothetical protein